MTAIIILEAMTTGDMFFTRDILLEMNNLLMVYGFCQHKMLHDIDFKKMC